NSSGTVHRDIYPDLTALFLDIIGTAAIGHSFGALQGKSDDFLSSFNLIVNQSTRPPHQFTTWWKYLPLPSNFKLARAFATVDHHLTTAIQERRSSPHRHASGPPDVLDLLLQARDELGSDEPPLSDREVRDNVLAIVANGYETVATSTALTLHLLACHPDSLERVRDEIDRAFSQHGDRLTKEAVAGMSYLDCVIQESLRLCPPMAGLQRISTQPDRLEGWSFPSQQVVGISLVPLHHSAQHFGEYPEQFRPERYREGGGCPFHSGSSAREGAERSHRHEQCASEPLTFGDGARKCLGETFARYEMKVVLATLLHRFHVQSIPDRSPNLELSKFGIFLSMIPENGVEIALSLR
ncbi:MAG: cytochrome P450, partial [Cyanobacteria bacterium P01_E01_bin.43]